MDIENIVTWLGCLMLAMAIIMIPVAVWFKANDDGKDNEIARLEQIICNYDPESYFCQKCTEE